VRTERSRRAADAGGGRAAHTSAGMPITPIGPLRPLSGHALASGLAVLTAPSRYDSLVAVVFRGNLTSR